VAEQSYWVRNEQGRVWGPYTLGALERLRGQLTEKCDASLDGQSWRPGTDFPELRELLAPARKVEKKAAEAPAGPRISKAMAEAFGIKQEDEPAAEPPPKAASKAASKPPPRRAPEAPPPPAEKPLELPESGDLALMSPVRLYALAGLTSASGWLQLELEEGHMLQISFRRGTPEHLSTDDPDLSLTRFLQSRGAVAPEKALAAEEQATKSGQDIVSVLFQMQLIPPADAHVLLGDYASFLLDRALVCWRGKFSFEKDAPAPPGAFPLGERWTLLAESVRRLDSSVLRARLGKKLLRPVVRSGGLGIGKVDELALNAQESRLYASIDGTRTGEELLKAQDPGVTLRLLYLLAELGHLAFAELPEEEPEAPPPPPPPPLPVQPAAVAAPAGKLPSNAERSRELPKSAREMGRMPPPRSEGPPVMKSAPPVMRAAPGLKPPHASPAPAAVKPAAPPPRLPPPPTFAQGPEGETPDAALERLSALLERLLKGDHYQALGMEKKNAGPAEAKRNFFVLAKELHPDTVSDPAQAELRDVKERLFSRINEAAQVLGDEKRRKEYEDELQGKKDSVDVARIFAAEENFQRAEIFIKARKYKEGLELLDKAIQMNAEEAEFYAWRGYARFLISRDRKEAYEECSADCMKAIKMVPKCLPAHLFLGHMSKVVGDLRLASKCFQEVLELEPKHVEAQRELRLMGKK
jgi:tetratricopeptide (TPR) repeat protein